MKRIFNTLMLVAAAAMTFTGCKKEISNPETGTHTVRFTAVYDNDTKTAMTETGTVATFKWTAEDEDRFIAFENGVAATETIGVLDEDNNTMELAATFGNGTAPYTYIAMLNGSVPATQTLYDGKYDEASDVLVAKPVTSETAVDVLDLQFKRVVALNKMTIKGLGADELVSKVIINSDKAIAGEYDAVNDAWKSSGTNTITLDGGDDEGTISDDSGNAVVYFNCVPVADAQLSITVTTDKATYTKTFAKTISLAESTLNKFGVTVEEPASASGWNLVTSASSLKAGDVITFTSAANGQACGAFYSSKKYLTAVAATFSGTTMEDNESIARIVLGGNATDGWTLSLDGADVCHKGSDLWNECVNDGDDLWDISIEDGTATVSAPGSDPLNRILFNKTNPRFKTYSSSTSASMLLVEIYKFTGTVQTVDVTGVALDKTSAEITVGDKETLVATVAPSNATNKAVTWTSSNTTVATVAAGVVTGVAAGTATITATTEDGGFTATCSVTVKEALGLTTVDQIFEAATSAGSTAQSVKVTFGNWIVSGVSGKNAYVTDGTKGFCIYQDGHGFVVGDILSGTVTCQVLLYNGFAELKGVTSSTTGITVTKGGTVTPQSIAISDLSGINTGAIITLSGVTYDGAAFTDGTSTITPYTTFTSLPTLHKGLKYNVKGMYHQYNSTREISPLSADDIEEVAATKYSVNIASGIVNGTVTTNVSEAAAGQEVSVTATPASGYKLSAITVKDASGNNVTVTGNKFTMPASAVTVSATFEEAAGVKYYVKVTSTASLTDGKYLIVYEAENKALNGMLTADAAENTVEVSISGGTIASKTDIDAAAVTYCAADGSFLGGGGKYIGHTGSSNSLNYSNSALANVVTFDSDGNAVITAGEYVMRFNSSSGQKRFRYYKSGQKAIQLYKLSD